MMSAKKQNKTATASDADRLWRVGWTYIRTVIDTSHEPFMILDERLRVLSANTTFYRFFKVQKLDTENRSFFSIGDGQWNIPALCKLLEKVVPNDTFFDNYEVEQVFPQIGRKILLMNARRVYTADHNQAIILLAMEDITHKKELEERLRDFATELNYVVTVRTKELEERVKLLEKDAPMTYRGSK
jgi:hypothetical protein